MDCDDYQRAALRTARDKGAPDEFIHLVLGLVGEAGEIAEKVKKLVRDKNSDLTQIDRSDIAAEIGDVLWYAAVWRTSLTYHWEISPSQHRQTGRPTAPSSDRRIRRHPLSKGRGGTYAESSPSHGLDARQGVGTLHLSTVSSAVLARRGLLADCKPFPADPRSSMHRARGPSPARRGGLAPGKQVVVVRRLGVVPDTWRRDDRSS